MSSRAWRPTAIGIALLSIGSISAPAAEKRIGEVEAIAMMRAAEASCRQAASADDRQKIWKQLVKDLRARRIEFAEVPVTGFISWLKWVPALPDEGSCAPAPGEAGKTSREARVSARSEMFDLAPDQIASEEYDRARRSSVGVSVVRTYEGKSFEWQLVLPPWAVREEGGAAASIQRGQAISFDCHAVLVSTTSLLCKVAGIERAKP